MAYAQHEILVEEVHEPFDPTAPELPSRLASWKALWRTLLADHDTSRLGPSGSGRLFLQLSLYSNMW